LDADVGPVRREPRSVDERAVPNDQAVHPN
jgi:hypothetical protein